jgi:hypothetical protein
MRYDPKIATFWKELNIKGLSLTKSLYVYLYLSPGLPDGKFSYRKSQFGYIL